MGRRYHFDCRNCGYSAEVSDGKAWGFFATVRTMVCADCEELVDVLTGNFGFEYKNLTEFKKYIGSGEWAEEQAEIFRKCPKCRSNKFLKKWNSEKHPCPCCGKSMVRDESIIIMWD